jgi:regulator of replication initiation timing
MKKQLSILTLVALTTAPMFGASLTKLERQLKEQMKIIQQLQKQVQELKKKEAENQKLKAEVQQLKSKLKSSGATGAVAGGSVAELKKEVEETKKIALSNQEKINPVAANDHIYWSYDLKSNFDYLYYETSSDPKNILTNTVFSNRVRLTGIAKPSDNLKATLQLEANNIYGMSSQLQYSPYQNISWVASETPDDTNLRVKQAFFNYFFGPNNGLMFSVGRRPATEGYPANLREGDDPNSPLAHLVNMEFDGISFQIGNDAISALSETLGDWGAWLKFCAGRGYSSSVGAFPTTTVQAGKAQIPAPPYTKDNLKTNDFAGFILVPYDDGTYALWTETIYAWNVKGNLCDNQGKCTFDDLGDVFGTNILFKITGISSLFGVEDSDFLDDTNAFISFATTRTLPSNGKRMLGTTKSKWGRSLWIGMDMPGFGDGDRFGWSVVAGSKYYRPFTYGEDTLIGSFAAARGQGVDLYYNAQIIPHLTAGLRGTYIKYNYAGSNAFFGDMGNPYQDPYVKKAMDLRAYIRYKF